MSGSICRNGASAGFRDLKMPMLFFLLSLVAPALSVAGEITVLTPSSLESSMLSRNKVVNVVVKVTEAADLNQLMLVDARDNELVEPGGRQVRNSIYYVHYRLLLKKGANNFTMMPGNRKLSIRYTPLTSLLNVNFDDPALYRFHRTETIPEECAACHTEKLPADAVIGQVRYGQFSPECYSCHSRTVLGSDWPHFPSSALLCRTCHPPGADGKAVSVATGKVEGLCFGCHLNNQRWSSMTHIHGPVGTGDCTICHDPHGNSHEFQLWADGKGKLCVVCHEEMKKYLETGQRGFEVHGIMNAQGCGACHSPHATNFRFQLFGEINDLCVRCHIRISGSEKAHPIQGHPVQGKKDPLREGVPLTCTSCHNPHGSSYRYLLIGDVRGGRICLKCHPNGRG